MKKRILSVVALALVLVMALASCGGTTKLTMGTGGTGGTYFAFGAVLSQYVEKNADVSCVAVSTDGSKANIQGIAAGDYQLGTVQSDVMVSAMWSWLTQTCWRQNVWAVRTMTVI